MTGNSIVRADGELSDVVGQLAEKANKSARFLMLLNVSRDVIAEIPDPGKAARSRSEDAQASSDQLKALDDEYKDLSIQHLASRFGSLIAAGTRGQIRTKSHPDDFAVPIVSVQADIAAEQARVDYLADTPGDLISPLMSIDAAIAGENARFDVLADHVFAFFDQDAKRAQQLAGQQ